MATIASIATAVPPYRMTCAEVKQAVRKVFPIAPRLFCFRFLPSESAKTENRDDQAPCCRSS